MICSRKTRRLALAATVALATVLAPFASVASAETIIDQWKTVAVPPPPQLKPVTVDSAHSALLILDVQAVGCSKLARPRCVESLPVLQKLLAQAREHHMLVVYSAGPLTSKIPPKPVDELAPLAGEPMVRGPADKFFGSDLESILSAKKITSVIVTGTSAEGAVLYTASSAALRNITAIVPVDGMSSVKPFGELYTAWHLRYAPLTITSHVTLTQASLITFN